MNPNWIKWKEGDKVSDEVLVFIVRQDRKEVHLSECFAFPVLIARCINLSGKERDWWCRLGRSNKAERLVDIKTLDGEKNPNDRASISLFDPESDVLYYTKDKFLDVPDIDEGQHVHISFDEILYRAGRPNMLKGRVTNKDRE